LESGGPTIFARIGVLLALNLHAEKSDSGELDQTKL